MNEPERHQGGVGGVGSHGAILTNEMPGEHLSKDEVGPKHDIIRQERHDRERGGLVAV